MVECFSSELNFIPKRSSSSLLRGHLRVPLFRPPLRSGPGSRARPDRGDTNHKIRWLHRSVLKRDEQSSQMISSNRLSHSHINSSYISKQQNLVIKSTLIKSYLSSSLCIRPCQSNSPNLVIISSKSHKRPHHTPLSPAESTPRNFAPAPVHHSNLGDIRRPIRRACLCS